MKRQMLLSTLFFLMYDGDTDAPTFAFDADGGTSAGKLTLVDDDNGTSAIDFGDGDSDTLDEAIATINALDDWSAVKGLGFDGSMSLKTADLTRSLADISTTIADNGILKPCVAFTGDETIASGSTVEPSSRGAIDVRGCGLVAVQLEATGDDAGATGTVQFHFQFNAPSERPAGNQNGTYAAMESGYDNLVTDEWDTLKADDEDLYIDLDGADTERKSYTLDLTGIDFIRLGQVTNPDDADITVNAWLLI